jgi:NMD protein affecting ribosome stability and mRNA decay
MPSEWTRRCPICGAPYKCYNMTVADQSACPDCIAEAERQLERPSEYEQERRRKRRSNFWR